MPADNDYKKYGISAIGNCLRLLFFLLVCIDASKKKRIFKRKCALDEDLSRRLLDGERVIVDGNICTGCAELDAIDDFEYAGCSRRIGEFR